METQCICVVTSDGLPEIDSPIVVRSQESRQPFRITKQEIKVCRQFNVPLPRCTYNERMEKRAKNLGGLVLAERRCELTGQLLQTVYTDAASDRIYEKDAFEKLFSS